MNHIIIMEDSKLYLIKRNPLIHLLVEVDIIRRNYDWLKIEIVDNMILGKGSIEVDGILFEIEIKYSPSFKYRMDRITVVNHKISFNHDIHVYEDLTLCLYHPFIDKPFMRVVPLHKMIPWISEWCHFYGLWKKYGVWLAPEIKH